MLTYNIDKRKDKPIYIYLYECIKNDIERGVLTKNFKLPSKRLLAEHLKISVLTVENSYFLLQNEGYIYSALRSGYFVSDIEELLITPKQSPPIKEENKKAQYDIDFCENITNLEHFPHSVWTKIIRKELAENSNLLKRPPSQGVYKLRKELSDYLYRYRGMTLSPEQIIIGAGTEYLYGLLIKILGKDNIYAVEDPGYSKISQIYNAEKVKTAFVALDEHGISVEKLRESQASVVHVSPAHHFPTGIVMPVKRRYELLNWANEEPNRYIIEDDYDSEFRYSGKILPTMQGINGERVIFINTFSKTISPGIRISYMVLPQHLISEFRQKLSFYSCTVSSIDQYVLATFIKEGYFERHINRMRKLYRQKRDMVISAIQTSPLGQYAAITEEESGLHFILHIDTNIPDGKLVFMARQRGLNISCLSEYAQNKTMDSGMLVINYSGIDLAKIGQAIDILMDITKKSTALV